MHGVPEAHVSRNYPRHVRALGCTRASQKKNITRRNENVATLRCAVYEEAEL